MTPEEIARLAEQLKQLNVAVKAGSASGTPSTPYYTGPAGLFGSLGLEREVISTRVQPRGLASLIPSRGTKVMNPLFPFFTGFLEGSGAEKDGVCDDPPVPGAGKSCYTTAVFGRYERQSRELELNRLGQQINRGEFQDLMIVNDPITNSLGDMMQPTSLIGGSTRLVNETAMRWTEMAVDFQKLLSRQTWYGNPANNSGGGGYKEFPGLNLLIGTGKVDAETGIACPSLDSKIVNYNYRAIDDTSYLASGGIVNLVTGLMRYLRSLADRTNLSPVNWVIVMREPLFYEITKVWACAYMQARCTTDNNLTVSVDGGDLIQQRDDMRNGQYLLVDGMRFPVVFDDAITELNNSTQSGIPAGSFASDIYILPTSVMGGSMASLYWEYYDYNDGPQQGINEGRLGSWYWVDGGRWLFHIKTPVNWCVQFIAKIEPRIILRTPHLAARIRNVMYTPLIHERDPWNDSPYFVNGGVSAGRTAPSYYNEWQV